MNPRIDQRIVPIVLAPQTLLTPATKEVFVGEASGGAWVNRTMRRVSRTGVDGSTTGNIFNAFSVEHAPSQVLIGIVSTSLPCGLNGILQVANKLQYTPPGLGRNTPKLGAILDGKFPDDMYSASIFIKVIGHKLCDGSSSDLYFPCRMNSRGVLSKPRHHNSWIWGFQPSTHWMKAVSLVLPLPGF